MKNLIASACIIALTATQSLAIAYEEPTVVEEPPVVSEKAATNERQSSGHSDADMLAILGAVALVVILANRQPRLDTPRPLVRPQTCMNKHAVIVACDDE